MLARLSNQLSLKLVDSQIISDEDKELYNYGIHLMLMSLITEGSILIFGALFRQFFLTVIFLITLISIRWYSGGYHAQHYLGCYFLSCTTYLVTLTSVINLTYIIPQSIIMLISCLSWICLFIIGSINSEKCPKTNCEMKTRKQRVRLLISLYTFISIIGLHFYPNYTDIWLLLTCNQVTSAIAVIILLIQRRCFR